MGAHDVVGLGTALALLGGLSIACGPSGPEQPHAAARDCPVCPEMVRVPGGRFRMGGAPGDRQAAEQPAHEVTVAPFFMSRYELRFDEWDRCARDQGCARNIIDQGWGRGAIPAFNVHWNDAQDYVRWLQDKTGKPYRLPTEAEWEYAARAGSVARYAWGSEMEPGRAVCYSDCGPEADQPAAVGGTRPNALGLYDLHGNLWEWVQDCWHDSYAGAPADGSAWQETGCAQRTIRGGSWNSLPHDVRSTIRAGMPHDMRYNTVGIRVVRPG